MEFHYLKLPLTLAILAVLVFHFVLKRRRANKTKTTPAVPALGVWPVIWQLFLLRQQPQMALGAMAEKYGPIFFFRIFFHKYLVVSSSDVAMELFKYHDAAISDRLSFNAARILGYGDNNFGLCPYNTFWRQMRKVTATELFSNRKSEMLRPIKASVVEGSIKELWQLWRKNQSESGQMTMELKKWLGDLNTDLMVRMVAGKRCLGDDAEARRLRSTLKQFYRLSGSFTVGDVVPFLRWADIGGHEKAMKKVAKELDQLLAEWLEEHRRNRDTSAGGSQDFIDALLIALDGLDLVDGHDVGSTIKATSSIILGGGTDAMTTTEAWILALLLNNPKVVQKVQEELDEHVGKERLVTELDITNLPYLQAIIKESFRLRPAAPIIPRRFSEACTVRGYHVPKGTKLLLNVWNIQTDPSIWSDPLEFKPERFFVDDKKDVDVKGHHFELLPFGGGRRMCPGVTISVQATQLLVASFLQAFEVAKAKGAPIDLNDGSGRITSVMTAPLETIIKPRLPQNLYQ